MGSILPLIREHKDFSRHHMHGYVRKKRKKEKKLCVFNQCVDCIGLLRIKLSIYLLILLSWSYTRVTNGINFQDGGRWLYCVWREVMHLKIKIKINKHWQLNGVQEKEWMIGVWCVLKIPSFGITAWQNLLIPDSTRQSLEIPDSDSSDGFITVFDLITAHTPISAQSRNSIVFRLQPV